MLPCGTKYLRVLIFAIFAEFFTIGKKNPAKKISSKIFLRKNLLHSRNYIKMFVNVMYKPSLLFRKKMKLETKHSGIK